MTNRLIIEQWPKLKPNQYNIANCILERPVPKFTIQFLLIKAD